MSDNTGNIKELIETAVQNTPFTPFELEGFKENPKLAILAGAYIGFTVGLNRAKAAFSLLVQQARKEHLDENK